MKIRNGVITTIAVLGGATIMGFCSHLITGKEAIDQVQGLSPTKQSSEE